MAMTISNFSGGAVRPEYSLDFDMRYDQYQELMNERMQMSGVPEYISGSTNRATVSQYEIDSMRYAVHPEITVQTLSADAGVTTSTSTSTWVSVSPEGFTGSESTVSYGSLSEEQFQQYYDLFAGKKKNKQKNLTILNILLKDNTKKFYELIK